METEVSYSKDLYQPVPPAKQDDENKDCADQPSQIPIAECRKLNVDKKYWRKYNPFEASKYYFDQEADDSRKTRKSLYDYERVIYNIDDKVEDRNIPNAVKVEHSMTSFKTSMLPLKRSMYESLYKGNLNRFHQSGKVSQNTNISAVKDI